jgi:hypothetical protein
MTNDNNTFEFPFISHLFILNEKFLKIKNKSNINKDIYAQIDLIHYALDRILNEPTSVQLFYSNIIIKKMIIDVIVDTIEFSDRDKVIYILFIIH